MAIKTVRVVGLDDLQRKLSDAVLLDSQLERVRDKIVSRIVDRPGKGAGARANSLRAEVTPLGATVVSTLNNPRQTGRAWQDKNAAIVKALAPRVIGKELKDEIESAWQ